MWRKALNVVALFSENKWRPSPVMESPSGVASDMVGMRAVEHEQPLSTPFLRNRRLAHNVARLLDKREKLRELERVEEKRFHVVTCTRKLRA